LEEAGHIQERWPKVMNEIDDKALDVTTVMILIRHYHQVAVAECLDIVLVVNHVELQPHNFHL
jgi:hypothetical protein